MNTLLAALGHGWPERAAQGALKYAIETEPRLRAAILAARGLNDVDVQVEEESQQSNGWRADLELRWDGGRLPIELKLGAPLTHRQREALRNEQLPIVVAPRSFTQPGLRVLHWATLAKLVRDPAVKRLLQDAESASSWWLEKIGMATLLGDLDALVGGTPFAGSSTHRFLSTVDVLLRSEARYAPSVPWSKSTTRRYLGYSFSWTKSASSRRTSARRSLWIGIWDKTFGVWEGDDKNRPLVTLATRRNATLVATRVASQVADAPELK